MTGLVASSGQNSRPYIGRYDTPKRRVVFRYSIGDLCLFRVGFDALLSHSPFDPEGERFAFPQGDPDFADGVDVIGYSGAIIAQDFPRLRRSRKGFYYVPNRQINYYIDLRQPFEAYLDGFSTKTRSTLRRKTRHVSQTMEFRCFRTADDVFDFHQTARQIAPKTYQERLFDGAIPDSPEFVTRLQVLAERDGFRGFTLSLNGRPVSYLYLPIENGVVIYGYLGYDPEFAKLSAGTALLYLALEQIFSENAHRYFDFTHGEGQTKRMFGRAACFRGEVYFFRWTIRNIVMVLGHLASEQFSEWIGRALSRLGLRKAVRKLLRRL